MPVFHIKIKINKIINIINVFTKVINYLNFTNLSKKNVIINNIKKYRFSFLIKI